MKTKNAVALALALIIGYLAYIIMRPFFIPIFWGVVFVILLYPYYLWLLRLVKWKSIASLIACLTVAVFMISPMVYIGFAMSGDIANLLGWVDEYVKAIQLKGHNSPLYILTELEAFLGRYIDVGSEGTLNMLRSAIKETLSRISFGLGGALSNVIGFFFNIVLSFLTMFFLFKDGDSAIGAVRDILPLSEAEKEAALKRMRTVLSATFYGGILIGALEGVILGIVFYSLGISWAALWGFAVFMATFIPVVSTAIIWVPAAIYLFAAGKIVSAITLAGTGIVVIVLVDQFLRQAVVSSRTKLHPLLLFLSVLGAVSVFGIIGIIAGPVILCAAVGVFEMYRGSVRGNKRG